MAVSRDWSGPETSYGGRMPLGSSKRPEQATTDESLRAEREKTDSELTGSLGAMKGDADAVLAAARDRADSALTGSRGREDKALDAGGTTAQAARVLERERAAEDVALSMERAGADADSNDELARREELLSNLLAFERKETDLRLRLERSRSDEALASRENFFAMVSHDLRSLLGGIVLTADLLTTAAKTAEPATQLERYADSIHRFSGRMERLISDLVDVASMEAGKLSLIPELADPRALVTESVEAFQAAATRHGVRISAEVGEAVHPMTLDRERILQVITNLVGNALKFTPRDGRITIRVEALESEVRFTVEDTGCGIAARQVDKIFERFVQLDPTDRRGLGLGLYIAKSIVEAHGGRIWVDSEAGRGSTFRFSLPCLRPA
jgi:signal transduction histidine kinase